MRHGRHRSLCTLTLTSGLETNRSRSRDIDAATMDRRSLCVDVEARGERAPDTPQINARRPAAARKPLHDVGICELLDHGAKHRSHTSQPEAKNTRRSKLPVTGHDLEVTGHDPRRARWLEAHKVRNPWPRHDKGVPAAHRHAVDIAQMIGFNRSARV